MQHPTPSQTTDSQSADQTTTAPSVTSATPLPSSMTPVSGIAEAPGAAEREPEDGIALCLSGGGYRAMLFHLGSVWRLHDAGLLPKLARISSVSGGSITAGVLGYNWTKLDFGESGLSPRFEELFCAPLRELAHHTIDAPSILEGVFLPGSVGDYLAGGYRKHLFQHATLQDLPDEPRFVFNSTNVGSRSLWRFSKPYMADWQVGVINNPTLELATAVAASSAFPPVLSPVVLRLKPEDYATPPAGQTPPLAREPFTTHVNLTDGGAYDNLGLETAWKRYRTILVSDAGGHVGVQEEPYHDWVRHTYRIWEIGDNQVRSLRKRQVIDSFQNKVRTGAYWGIRTNIEDYGLPATLPCPVGRTTQLAEVATRLAALDDTTQERLINWGYAVTDAALRRHYQPELAQPKDFPYPRAAV